MGNGKNSFTSKHVSAISTPLADADEVFIEKIIEFSADETLSLLGPEEQNYTDLNQVLHSKLHIRGGKITLSGTTMAVTRDAALLDSLRNLIDAKGPIDGYQIKQAVSIENDAHAPSATKILGADIVSGRGKVIRAKTHNQKRYVDAIDNHSIVFGVGPAGTGKTYLAVAKAVAALRNKEVAKIILTRPAVEAGERLGFLPGGLTEKIDPYLRPLIDALSDMMEQEIVSKLLATGVIEVAPLAYMRGRTLSNAFIILDEAQNTTAEQMKMFLTRLGFDAKMVITGDASQIDLPSGQKSGLATAKTILADVDGIYFADLTSNDVVRHRLVASIIDAYDRHDRHKTDPQQRSES